MKTVLFGFGISLLAYAPLEAVAASRLTPRSGWTVIDTAFTYEELNRRLDQAIAANNMNLVTQASASIGARAAGIKIPGNRVVGVFRNDYARRMLAADIAAGLEAPVRFYIVENTDGKATLAWHVPSDVFAPYYKVGGQPLRALASELDGVFAKIASDAAGQ